MTRSEVRPAVPDHAALVQVSPRRDVAWQVASANYGPNNDGKWLLVVGIVMVNQLINGCHYPPILMLVGSAWLKMVY